MRRQKYPGGRPADKESDRSDSLSQTAPKRTKIRRTPSAPNDAPLLLKGAEGWVKPAAPKKKRSTTANPKQVERAVAEFQEICRAKDWHCIEPRHALGLYVACHRRVYGVDPADLFANWAGANSAVRAMLIHEFGGEPARMVAFLQWAWAREQARERQRGGDQSYRLGWRQLFVRQAAAGILTDYRTSLARAARTRENPRG